MPQENSLRGMAWDHPRAVNPLEAISAEWAKTSEFAVEWDARPLKDFEVRFLEMNPLPTFAVDGSFGILAELEGRDVEQLLAEVFALGLTRLGIESSELDEEAS